MWKLWCITCHNSHRRVASVAKLSLLRECWEMKNAKWFWCWHGLLCCTSGDRSQTWLLLVESFVSDMLSFNFGKNEFSISERTKNLEERLEAIFVSDKNDCCLYWPKLWDLRRCGWTKIILSMKKLVKQWGKASKSEKKMDQLLKKLSHVWATSSRSEISIEKNLC